MVQANGIREGALQPVAKGRTRFILVTQTHGTKQEPMWLETEREHDRARHWLSGSRIALTQIYECDGYDHHKKRTNTGAFLYGAD